MQALHAILADQQICCAARIIVLIQVSEMHDKIFSTSIRDFTSGVEDIAQGVHDEGK